MNLSRNLLALTTLAALTTTDANAQCHSKSIRTNGLQSSFTQSRTSSVRLGGFGRSSRSRFNSSFTSINSFGSTGGVQFVTTQPTIVQPIIVQQPVVVQQARPFFGQQVVGQQVVGARPFFGQQVVGQQLITQPIGRRAANRTVKTVTKTKVKSNGTRVTKTKVKSKRSGRRRR